MKKFLSLLLVLVMVCTLIPAASYTAYAADTSSASDSDAPPPIEPESGETEPGGEPNPDVDPNPVIPSVPDPVVTEPDTPGSETESTEPQTESTEPQTESTEPQTEPTETNPPSPSTQPTTKPGGNNNNKNTTTKKSGIVVDKQPQSRTVNAGESAEFEASAQGSTKIVWHLLSPTSDDDLLAEKAPERFSGLKVEGFDKELLKLENIPREMNGWRIRAEFFSGNSSAFSTSAILNVQGQALSEPTILQDPKPLTLNGDEIGTLEVVAETSGGAELTYQWYRNKTDSTLGGKAILGATASRYTPEAIEGTNYYYCAVRSSSGNEISAPTKSRCAAVTYDAAPVTEPSSEETTEVTELTKGGILDSIKSAIPFLSGQSNSLLVIVIAAVAAIAVLGIIATIIILKFYNRGEDDDYEILVYDEDPAVSPAARAAVPDAAKDSAPAPESAKKKDPEWDDLGDLDLSYYLNDDNE